MSIRLLRKSHSSQVVSNQLFYEVLRPGPTSECSATVLGAMAELERSLICERVKAGLRNARERQAIGLTVNEH